MNIKPHISFLIGIFALMLVFGGTTLAQNQRGNCSDAAIARSIKSHIRSINAKNPRKNLRINVRVNNRAVTLSSRQASGKDLNAVRQYAKGLRCVRRVVNIPPQCQSVGCPVNTYKCGGQCIPCRQTCNP